MDNEPKRLLALDGGGVRGLITACFLERMEMVLRERHGDASLRLCDYFDLVGGTSAGALLAAGVAVGMEASQIRELAITCSNRIFASRRWQRWESVFDPAPLKGVLKEVFGDLRLGDEAVRTGLVIVTKRADTRSTWPLHNNPQGKFYQYNKEILLRDALYASAAAPFYFVPEQVAVGDEETGAFVDGGVSMANNPAWLMYLMVTLEGFNYKWRSGENELFICSVGTGQWRQKDDIKRVTSAKVWDWATEIPHMLIKDANINNQLLLQAFSKTIQPWTIDREIGDLAQETITEEPLFTYLRYDAPLDQKGLKALGLESLTDRLARLRNLSASEQRDDFLRIGEAAAKQQVSQRHFPAAFDVGGRIQAASKVDCAQEAACASRGTLYVGLVGVREMSESERKSVYRQLLCLLGLVRFVLHDTATDNRPYDTNPKCVLVDSLAEGVDQIAAEIALAYGYSVIAPLPFDAQGYKKYFTVDAEKHRRRFDELLQSDEVIVVEGDNPHRTERERTKGYSEASKQLLQRSDMLIAVSRTNQSEKAGGTKDTVGRAVEMDMPVIAVDPEKDDYIMFSGPAYPEWTQVEWCGLKGGIEDCVASVLKSAMQPR